MTSMNAKPVSVVSLDDDQLIEFISRAEQRILMVCPGVNLRFAKKLGQKWHELGRESVSIVLDVDPEVCRLGLGTVEAIELLQSTAHSLGREIYHRPGIRIGLLVSDRAILAFAPTPLLIEAESTQFPRPNAILVVASSNEPANMMHNFEKEAEDLIIESEPLKDDKLEEVKKDLESNPPLRFDLARKVRVFNAQFQFVEFRLSGLLISRMSAHIPSDLMGLAKDEQTQRLLHSTFKLVRGDSKISGEKIHKSKRKIAETYLVHLRGYGTVCLRTNKDAFLAQVKTLQGQIEEFSKQVSERLQKEIDANRERLVKALLPSVIASPPERWTKLLGLKPSKSGTKECLEVELARHFGSAQDLISEMKADVIFKDVTFESLSDSKFIDAAEEAQLPLKSLLEEYFAAKEGQASPEVNA